MEHCGKQLAGWTRTARRRELGRRRSATTRGDKSCARRGWLTTGFQEPPHRAKARIHSDCCNLQAVRADGVQSRRPVVVVRTAGETWVGG